ncbi:hypothetical protein ACU5AX_07850 [Sphingomonas sp. XXL09]|uniref:hypothetical protein n=1 Tax=Sphingomonas sp. XXL09 TaxID=3457787 RepID=UPI00406BB689
MKIAVAAALGLAISVGTPPLHAQSSLDDVRCLLISNVVGPKAENDASRKLAAMTSAYYLGRISNLPSATITSSLRQLGKGISGADAVKVLKACAARAQATNQRLAAAAKAAAAK